MYFRFSFRETILKLLFIFIIAGMVGFLFNLAAVFIAVSAIVLLIWHYRHLHLLTDWLWRSKSISPPSADGVWGEVFDGLYRQTKQNRQKQKLLSDKIRQFRDGAEALPDAALVLSQELLIQWGNKKAQRILGIRSPGDVGQRIDNLIRFPEFTQYLENGDFSTPCLIGSPINSELVLELRLMPYGTDQVLLLGRDVSKIQQLEEMRRDFVANVSHELKTPLTVVRGYIEMAQTTEHALDPYWSKVFDTVEGQVTRMDRLVEQLLVLSRVEINADSEDKQLVDVPKMLTGLLADGQWLNQDKGHTITSDIDQDILVEGIEGELKSAYLNLISNAIAYTPEGGEIFVKWKKEGNKAIFSVKDNGPGIRPEHVNRLTERFFRVDKSRSRNTGGSGLGLAIVKHVLNHHHAELVISSKWQKGSEFAIHFDLSVVKTR